jgi:3-hydroxybutyryl-CoA dehydrogenase
MGGGNMSHRADQLRTVCVVGPGFMGAQIALQCAVHGCPVSVIGRSRDRLDRVAKNHIEILESRLASQEITADEKQAIADRLRYTTNLKEAVSGADIVIEAVPERLDLKRQIFSGLDAVCPKHTILATNSSSIRVSLIEDATRRPDKVLNMHFYAPVWQTTMVELMRGTRTTEDTIEDARILAMHIGLTPLVVKKQSTGFIMNRVWHVIKKECLHIVDEGVASPEDVDLAWTIFTKMPIGPFFMMDVVGLDIVKEIEDVYYRESGNKLDAPPKVLLDKIESGDLGVKTGKGFYSYTEPA